MRRILIVDDSNLLHSMFKVVLGRLEGYRLSFAKNGQEALDSMAKEGNPDLIVLDINMPVMNGLEFLRCLEEAGLKEQLPVIIVSTEGREEDVLRGLEAGARAYLRKPFRPDELRELVQKVMG